MQTSAIIIKCSKSSLIRSAKIESLNQRLPRIGLGEYSSLSGTFLGHQRQQLPGHSDGIATAGELQVLFRHPGHGAACLSQIELQTLGRLRNSASRSQSTAVAIFTTWICLHASPGQTRPPRKARNASDVFSCTTISDRSSQCRVSPKLRK